MDAVALDLCAQTSPLGTKRSVNLVGPDGPRISFHDARDPGAPDLDPAVFDPAEPISRSELDRLAAAAAAPPRP